MSHVLRLLGRGLDWDLEDLLQRYLWARQTDSLEQLQQELRQEPQSGDVLYRLGLAHLTAQRNQEALRHLGQAVSCQSDHLGAQVALAATYDKVGDLGRAAEHLEAAVAAGAEEPEIVFAAGLFCERLGRTSRATAHYREALNLDETCTQARERLAAVAIFQGNWGGAIDQYRPRLEAEPEQTWIQSSLGHLYYLSGLYGPAIEQFQTAIVMQPESWSLGDDQIEEMTAAGRIPEAIELVRDMLQEQGPFADLYCRLGDLYSKTGLDTEAVNEYHVALDLQPDYMEAMIKLGTHHLVCGRWEQAAEAFHKAAQINDMLLLDYVGTAVAQLADGDEREAANSFELASAVEPNGTLLLTETVRLQQKAAVDAGLEEGPSLSLPPDPTEIDLYNEWLLNRQIRRHAEQVQLMPACANLRYRYGVLLRYQERIREAAEQFTEAVRLNCAYTEAIMRLGFCQSELGQKEHSQVTFKQALDVPPSSIDLHYRLGLMYADCGQFEQVMRQIETAEAATSGEQIRSGLVLSLRNMGLIDGAAATWRDLCRLNHATAD